MRAFNLSQMYDAGCRQAEDNKNKRDKESAEMFAYQTPKQIIEDVCKEVLLSFQMTDLDFNLLSLVLEPDLLDEHEKRLVHRLLYAMRKGWLTFVGISDEQIGPLKSRLERAIFS